MGRIVHHAIIVTSWDIELIKKTRIKASTLFENVTPLIWSPVNTYKSFMVPPDGSKENWPESGYGNSCRQELIKWMESQAHEDGSNNLQYIEVEYGNH